MLARFAMRLIAVLVLINGAANRFQILAVPYGQSRLLRDVIVSLSQMCDPSRLRLLLLLSAVWLPTCRGQADEWSHYGGDSGGSRYSALKPIDRTNVARLKIAWEFTPETSRTAAGAVLRANSRLRRS